MILCKNDILITGAASRSPTNEFLILCADRPINKNLPLPLLQTTSKENHHEQQHLSYLR